MDGEFDIQSRLEAHIRFTREYVPFKLPMTGTGILAGQFPDGITSIEGEPTPATVRVLYRPEPGAPGDGVVVAEVQSNQDGTWLVEGLNPNLKFDVVGRKSGFNDVIMADVTPYTDDVLLLTGGFEVAEDGRTLEGLLIMRTGVGPYTVEVVGNPPPGIAFMVSIDSVMTEGEASDSGPFSFTLVVRDANGLTATHEVNLEIPKFFQKGMLAMAYACNRTHRLAYNPEATGEPTYEDYFKNALEAFDREGIDPPIKYLMSSGLSEVAVDTTLVPFFDERWVMVLGAGNGTWSGDMQEGTYEFLNADGAVVAVLQTFYAGTYASGIRYGYNLGSLIVAPRVSYGGANGYVTLRDGLLKYEPINPTASSRHDPFSLQCDTASIVGLRVKVSARSTYTSSNGGAAYTYLRVLPEEEWAAFD